MPANMDMTVGRVGGQDSSAPADAITPVHDTHTSTESLGYYFINGVVPPDNDELLRNDDAMQNKKEEKTPRLLCIASNKFNWFKG